MSISLRDYRRNVLKISQEQAAKALGVHQNTLSRWEKNPEKLQICQLKHIAGVYGFYWLDFF